MEQGTIDEDLESLEEWYAKSMTQGDPTKILDHPYSESLDIDAIEAQVSTLMGEIDVTQSLCSICHSMLDNFPDSDFEWTEHDTQIARPYGDRRCDFKQQQKKAADAAP
ncbi:hypothetical protein LA080_007066 [Diaporthe eres]|uniref:Uncharacterized protein n=1 Tax=Diaporthe vaccinii TaxID=105482 RepID=A0ABR4DT45_9PEZI|nr:hypothetical protein LA080_007066 [Diaporthe eres]